MNIHPATAANQMHYFAATARAFSTFYAAGFPRLTPGWRYARIKTAIIRFINRKCILFSSQMLPLIDLEEERCLCGEFAHID